MSSVSNSKDIDCSTHIDLRILSPSTEVERELSFQCLPASTTIAQLKERIQKSIPSGPEAYRQRLIFRGRVIMKDDATLIDVFGKDSINQSQSHSLHLVLRELVDRSDQSKEDIHRPRPERVSTLHPQPRASAQYLEQKMSSNEPNEPIVGAQTMPQSNHTYHHTNNNEAGNADSQPSKFIAGDGYLMAMQGQNASRVANSDTRESQSHSSIPVPSVSQGSEHVRSSNLSSEDHHKKSCSYPPQSVNGPPPPIIANQSTRSNSNSWTEKSIDLRSLSSKLEALKTEIKSMDALLATTCAQNPQLPIIENLQKKQQGLGEKTQDMINELSKACHKQDTHASHPSPESNALIQDLINQLQQQKDSMYFSNKATDPNRTNVAKSRDNLESQAAFLVRNQHGPYAVVYSNNNAYVSSQRFQPFPRIDTNILFRSRIGSASTAQSILHNNNNNNNNNNNSNNNETRAVPVITAQPTRNRHQNRHQNAANNAREEQNADQGLQNIAGHLWLFVQTIGFIFLFGGSMGWRRQLFFVAMSLLFYTLRLGLLGDRWARVREYLEGLLPTVDGVGRQRRRGRRARTSNRRGSTRSSRQEEAVPHGGNTNRPDPTPEDRARSLLRQRQERLWDTVTDQFRNVERILALFVATLWPGVGERHIAARRDAEAEANRENDDGREAEAMMPNEQSNQTSNASADNTLLSESESREPSSQAATRTENEAGGSQENQARQSGDREGI